MDAFEVDKWLGRASRWLIPPRCLLCGERGVNGLDLCLKCQQQLTCNDSCCPVCAVPLPAPDLCADCLRQPPPVGRVHAVFVYGFPFDRLVPRFKFHRDLAAGRLMAGLMAPRLASVPRPDALLPVPLHPLRLRQRGYDQAMELARPLSRQLGIPLRADLLQRMRDTRPQSELDASARQRNLRGAFTVTPQAMLPAHVVLVDDVMTTGATLYSAARALQRAGIQRVDAWVCARVP